MTTNTSAVNGAEVPQGTRVGDLVLPKVWPGAGAPAGMKPGGNLARAAGLEVEVTPPAGDTAQPRQARGLSTSDDAAVARVLNRVALAVRSRGGRGGSHPPGGLLPVRP